MKQFLKQPLGLAVAGALIAGASTVASAANTEDFLGNAAIIPYYTVMDNYVTGVHITNTTNAAQVVKVRLRRSTDSADVMDFNIIMSPQDVWTGSFSGDEFGIQMKTSDTTCTAPVNSGVLNAPAVNLGVDAQEGYIEIIGMGEATAASPVGQAATHAVNASGDRVPASCSFVAENFLAANVTDLDTTQSSSVVNPNPTGYLAPRADALKVSSFIRDASTGMEFGSNAAHFVFATPLVAPGAAPTVANTGPMMANQELGLLDGDTNGYDFPNLDGSGIDTNNLQINGLYDASVRLEFGNQAAANDTQELINDWSYNASNGVSTDWVITVPGQYLMTIPAHTAAQRMTAQDLPLRGTMNVYDREEGKSNSLVVSPGSTQNIAITQETTVIEWGGQKVFNSTNPIEIMPALTSPYGWAQAVLQTTSAANQLEIYNLATNATSTAAGNVQNSAPILGFAAWQRTFADPSKNYGRIIEHSRK